MSKSSTCVACGERFDHDEESDATRGLCEVCQSEYFLVDVETSVEGWERLDAKQRQDNLRKLLAFVVDNWDVTERFDKLLGLAEYASQLPGSEKRPMVRGVDF
jgi:hypothetical protein